MTDLPKLDLPKFFRACKPSKTLRISNPDDKQYYIDFSSVRGETIIQELKRTITILHPEEKTCQLFTGHIGCGKSTELLRLKAELEQQDFHVVYFESNESLDLSNIDVTDILLAIASAVSKSLEEIHIDVNPGMIRDFVRKANEFLQTPIDLEAKFSVILAELTVKTKNSSDFRSQLRQYLEPRTSSILQSINDELLQPAQQKLNHKGKKGLVVIIDNLDRIDNVPKSNGQYQPEYLFVERGDQLNNLNCHVVYTIPLILTYSNALGRLQNRFGKPPKVLPMVAVKRRDQSDYTQGIELLKQMVMSRAFPGVSWTQSQNLITKVFENVDTLERLCKVSGGHLRDIFLLLHGCLEKQDPPISHDCLEQVITANRNLLSKAIDPQEWKLLQQVSIQGITGDEQYTML
ncbi:MAG: AAA family ATPase, partial [Sphaerospermopsis sp. SIO1G2]|nr:AAA family ATPase [Sphaerospermopsis sp. SIO1G2]